MARLAGCTVFLLVSVLHAETGYDAWLRYAPLETKPLLPAVVQTTGGSVVIQSACDELIRGIRGMTGRTLRVVTVVPKEDAIVLQVSPSLPEDGFQIHILNSGPLRYIHITGANDRGLLYGVFHFLRKVAIGESIANLNDKQSPAALLRWVNHWDNLDGTIERGYGGSSIFWDHGHVRTDLTRVNDYARMLASIGINGCSINNVNTDKRVLTAEYLPEVARIAAVFRRWGVRVVLSVDFGSPQSLGNLATFDPLDPAVAEWWQSKTDEIYRAIPDLGGFILKADSEGRVGPSTYGRTHADAANMIARALKPHDGLLFYRGFVYDHHADWRNLKNDRARAAYDNFHGLDGKFDENVVIQIKHGPIDFQVREPVSPLFGALDKTRKAIELQITQEYFGQGRHTVFLVPMWKDSLDFDLHAAAGPTPVKSLITAFVGVSNAGMDENWYGNHLSQANLYGFGRLAWNPNLSSRGIADEWSRLTFGKDPKVVETIAGLQLSSWRTYENYTGPLGLQTLTDIAGNHYGVAVEASERNGWGQWHRADEHGVGMDRTVATGTGYIGQYRPAVARMFESLATCPDNLLLFMHHVPYTHVLHSGKTIIQFIYDSHYEGAAAVTGYVQQWMSLRGRVDEGRYNDVLAQLQYQEGQAQVWRDAVTSWFRKESGIPDTKGRVGNYPGRTEAESMHLQGYEVKPVTPWEAASGGKAIECAFQRCIASFHYGGPNGWFSIHVQYFDQNTGAARYRVYVGNQLVDQWIAANQLPTRKVDGGSSTRRAIGAIALRTGDEIRIEGIPDGAEVAALDYVELKPVK